MCIHKNEVLAGHKAQLVGKGVGDVMRLLQEAYSNLYGPNSALGLSHFKEKLVMCLMWTLRHASVTFIAFIAPSAAGMRRFVFFRPNALG